MVFFLSSCIHIYPLSNHPICPTVSQACEVVPSFKSIYDTSQEIVPAVQSAVMDAESQVSRSLNPLVPSGSFLDLPVFVYFCPCKLIMALSSVFPR